MLSQIREETDKLISEKNRLTKAALSYYGTIVKNSTMEEYSSRASALTRRCELLFENALRARAHYFDVVDYMGSVDYRIVKQEVTRLRFENEDLRRHLDFWQKQNGTLFLAAQTSPRGLEDARDALYRELKSYENDAVLMRLLKDTTLTKEERAQLIIKLKETLRSELQLLQDQRAHADKEAMFIETARREIFNLLRSVWKNIMADKLSVKCGTSALTDVVTDTFKSEFS